MNRSKHNLVQKSLVIGAMLVLAPCAARAASVSLAWDPPVPDDVVAGYKVYYGETSRNYSSSIDAFTATNASVPGLDATKTYFFAVTAYNSTNEESEYSAELVWDNVSPTRPTDLSGTVPSFSRVDLVWTSSTDDVAVTGYEIKRDGTVIDTVTTTQYADTSVSPNTSYEYTVEALDQAENRSGLSDVCSMTTPQIPDDITNGMVGSWRFEENQGTSTLDASAEGNALTLYNGVSWTTGKAGAGVSLDGVDDYLARGDTDLSGAIPGASSSAAEDFTVGAWVKLDQTGMRHPIVNKKGYEQQGWMFFVEEDNTLILQVFDTSGSKLEIASSSTLRTDQWHYVAATYDDMQDGTAQVRVYLDGQDVASSDAVPAPLLQNAEALEIGRYYWSTSYSRYFLGDIDGVRLYSRALTADELAIVMTVTATAANSAPQATDDTAATLEDTAVSIDVKANDTDADGDALTLSEVSQPANGLAVIDTDDSVTYTPNEGWWGTDSFTYVVADPDGETSSATVTITVSPVNQAPQVGAGSDAAIEMPTNAVALDGTVSDDGVPVDGTLATAWTKVSGSGTVAFGNAEAVDTTASFSEADTYVLRLTASDGALTTYDELTVVVSPEPNTAPTVDAGSDQEITFPTDTVELSGKAADDGHPVGSSLTTTWAQDSGPGTATFDSADALTTSVSFDKHGTYVLRLTADDGSLSTSDTVSVIVNKAPRPNPPENVHISS